MRIVDKRRNGLADCGAIHPSWREEVKLKLSRHVWNSKPKDVQGFLPLANFMNALAGRATLAPLVITLQAGARTHQERPLKFKWSITLRKVSSDNGGSLPHC
jgi:hypothetical protein